MSQAFMQICKYGFAVFHQDLQALAIHRKVSQGFARFRKVSQVRKSWFFARICNEHLADVGEAGCQWVSWDQLLQVIDGRQTQRASAKAQSSPTWTETGVPRSETARLGKF